MEKGTAVFYHRHIQSNIDRLDERKDRFIHHRMDFLKQYCQPIQQKITRIKEEIERYKTMRDTQEEVIESEPAVVALKEEVASYQHTRDYFTQKVNEYEQKSLEYQQYIQDLKNRLQMLKNNFRQQHQDMGFQLPFITKQRVYSMQDDTDTRSAHSQSFVLPSIRLQRSPKNTESSMNQSQLTHKPKIIRIGQKIQRLRNLASLQHSKSVVEDDEVNEEPKVQVHENDSSPRKEAQSLRERVTQFNKTESLFNECFQVKKNAVQRCVSQLQSKLILHRQQFLNTCQAIGSKEQSVTLQTFDKLSSDQILTLFISFVWLNKKVKAEFVAKRKLIMEYIGKLPKV